MSTPTPSATETVLVIGATGNIGVSAVIGALRSGRNVLAIVRNQDSAKKLFEHVNENHERITVVEADVVSDQGVQKVVDKVRAGTLPAFQHVYTTAGGSYSETSLLEITTQELHKAMAINFESNFFAYRATVPYLLEQTGRQTTFTICTGAQGDLGYRGLPAMTQGALFSMSIAASRALHDTSVHFNELYLALRVEVDSMAEKNGVMKSSTFARTYEKMLARPDLRSCRVRVDVAEDVDELKIESRL